MNLAKMKLSLTCKTSLKDRDVTTSVDFTEAGSVKLVNILLQKNDGVRKTESESLLTGTEHDKFLGIVCFFHNTVKGELVHTSVLSGNTTLTLAPVMEKTSPYQ